MKKNTQVNSLLVSVVVVLVWPRAAALCLATVEEKYRNQKLSVRQLSIKLMLMDSITNATLFTKNVYFLDINLPTKDYSHQQTIDRFALRPQHIINGCWFRQNTVAYNVYLWSLLI